jgi:predicted dienelactone hydrolase
MAFPRHRMLMLLVGLSVAGCATARPQDRRAPTPTLDRGAGPVGTTKLHLEDAARQRPLVTRLWYPADAKTRPTLTALDWIFVAHGVPEAPMAAQPQKLPLVLLSHGTGGSPASLVWLAERLAAHGYLVAAVEHFGNAYGNDTPEGAMAQWRRPVDLSRTLDALLADARFAPRIDATRVGAAGMSSGGYTVIALSGGIYHPERMGALCQEHPSRRGCRPDARAVFASLPDRDAASSSYKDPRFRAVFAIAPALGPGFAADDLADITIPVGIVASARDEWVPLAENAGRYAQWIPKAQLTVLPAGGHFTFLSLCNEQGRTSARDICIDLDPAVDRAAAHEQVGTLALEFFDTHLRPPGASPAR